MVNREKLSALVLVVAVLLLLGSTLAHSLLEVPKWRAFLEERGFIDPIPQIALSTTEVRPGDFFLLTIKPLGKEQVVEVEGAFLSEQPALFPYEQGKAGMIPLTYRTIPGKYRFLVTVSKGGQVIVREEKEITVQPREFAVQRMSVSKELHAKRNEKLWAEDHVFTEESRRSPVQRPLWEGTFIMPVVGRITTDFGQIRIINGVDGGRHSGLDILAPIGTPILAGNTGVVVLACHLNVTGNTVILDHGWNLFSSYSHLDEINVEVGQRVVKGEAVGTAGNTGFSTAPHLHWALSVGKVFVDPYLFLAADPLN